MKKTIPISTFSLLSFLILYGCAGSDNLLIPDYQLKPISEIPAPDPDPRVGLASGVFDAEETIWNLRLLSLTPTPENFLGAFNTDLAFQGNYAFMGNYNGFMVWDISQPENPELVTEFVCPASQSDISVYKNLLFVSGEGLEGRLDCGADGVRERVSDERLRGIRIFDISDVRNPTYISNVQTCRGSHTHSVLADPNDPNNIYVYVSGSAPVRPDEELPGCSSGLPDEDEDSALFRIEVIKVPLAAPETAHIVNSPRIFDGLEAPPTHGLAPEDQRMMDAAIARARAENRYIVDFNGMPRVLSDNQVRAFLRQIVGERGGEGDPTEADSLKLREAAGQMYSDMITERLAARGRGLGLGPNQCHDITVYPEKGLAGGACEGYGILLDISDPANPFRMDAVADSNFAYWHSATFNNDGTTVIFTDEWGGGTQAKCRTTDPLEWGANAIFSIEEGKMVFQSYFKMSAPQTSTENCVAHNGSLIPVPGRDVMVQGWYQGGINVFDFTDPANPIEMAFHDRGPISDERMVVGGSWSVYWYNGYMYNSEIVRGLDVFELVPSPFITQNEIDAAKTVVMDLFNAQGQPKFFWPASFAKSRAYVDQLERNRELDMANITMIRRELDSAESVTGFNRSSGLNSLVVAINGLAAESGNQQKMMMLRKAVKELADEADKVAG